jgi:hypothetical protein
MRGLRDTILAEAGSSRAFVRLPGSGVRPMSTRGAAGLGGGIAIVAAGLYLMAAGRPLDYDSSVTVGIFVKSHSLVDPLRRQVALNNHPLFSIIEHVLWTAGLRSETWLRIPPILFGAATIAVVTWWCAKSFGALPGACAGVIVAANPMFAELSRSPRGYSLLCLCAVCSTMLLWRLVERSSTTLPDWVPVAYVLLLAAGISTHLYGSVVLVVHVGIVVARREFGPKWLQRWVVGIALGCLVYLPTINNVIHTRNARTFYPRFPLDVAEPLLGQAHVAVILLGCVALGALWMARGRPSALGGVLAIVVFVVFVWLVVQPQFLVARYLVWLVPGVALACAALVARQRLAVIIVAIAVVAMVAHQWSHWTATEVPSAQTAAMIDAARSEGLTVCGLQHTAAGVLAYTAQPTRAITPAQIAKCDVALGFYVPRGLKRFAAQLFPYHWQVPGEVPADVYSKRPQSFVDAGLKRTSETLTTHPITWPR